MKTRRLAILLPFLLTAALASAAPGRPDVRRLSDGSQALRAEASAAAKVLDSPGKGEPFLVLQQGLAGAWLKVRSATGQEGYLPGTALDRPSGAFFKEGDFPSAEVYARYLGMALRRGERVRATSAYEKVEEGDLGWFFASGEGDPPFLVVWDRDLEASPLDSALDAGLSRILADRIYFVYADVLEAVGEAGTADFSALALDWADARAEEFSEGAQVSLGAHLQVDPDSEESANWNEDMGQYAGQIATITGIQGRDPWDRLTVTVDIDGGEWQWRIENMRLEPGSDSGSGSEYEDYGEYGKAGASASLDAQEGYGMIGLGSVVILGKHDAVAGNANWNEEMDQYVGTRAKVTSLDGSDDSGCLGVRVEGNGFFWRVRNLALEGRGAEGSYGFEVGDRVILGGHREINGEANWSDEMAAYVGKEATITEAVGLEDSDSRCYIVTVDLDGGDWVWRVENMTPSP
jgi:hypothetical protein